MRETDESTVLVGDFNISLLVITRTTKTQMYKDVKPLPNTTNKLEYSNPHSTFTKIE